MVWTVSQKNWHTELVSVLKKANQKDVIHVPAEAAMKLGVRAAERMGIKELIFVIANDP